jgi:hypothetical protein
LTPETFRQARRRGLLVRDRATVERPNQYAEGIDFVLVSGRVVKDPQGFRRDVRVGEAIKSVV